MMNRVALADGCGRRGVCCAVSDMVGGGTRLGVHQRGGSMRFVWLNLGIVSAAMRGGGDSWDGQVP